MPARREPPTAARVAAIAAGLSVLLGASLLLAASLGAGRVSPLALLGSRPLGDVERTILLEVRLPRVLLAALLGGALGLAGAVFQGLLRNPLADPYVLGVSGGASIGGVLALLLGPLGTLSAPLCAFAGALGALVLIERVATVDGRMTVYGLLLTGAIFNAFSASLIYFVQSVASLQQLHAIVFYLMGHIPSFGLRTLGLLALAIGAGALALCAMSRDYNVLTLGEEGALQLGVDVERVRRRTFVLGSLLTALTVSVSGMIGFVGLVVPHMLRLLFGPDHRVLLPAAFLGGASFLVLADLAARLLVAPNELPVGVVTALLGGPFFLVLLHRRGRHVG
ncbi:MAG TPA: iron ABC transporter permease [Candidatus Polarisedimenticolaceae bacterium]|nr:iron ABC transporter permease [Candidatus Polarisedimenticolaceae bacterium]